MDGHREMDDDEKPAKRSKLNVLHIEERKEVNDQEFKNIKQPLEAKPDYMPVEKANENNDDQEFMNTDQLFEDEQDHKPVEERKGIGQQVPIIIQELLKVESESTPVAGYSEQIAAVEQRNAAMDFLERNMGFFENDPLVHYVAMTHFDYYISRNPQPNATAQHLNSIVMICLTIACKYRKHPYTMNLFHKLGNFGDDLGDIPNQLELKVDQVPEMQMRRDAAMTFVKYFVSKLTKVDDQQQKEGLESEAIKVLLRTQKVTKFTELLPSLLAASSVLAASAILHPMQYNNFKEAILNLCPHISKDVLLSWADEAEVLVVGA